MTTVRLLYIIFFIIGLVASTGFVILYNLTAPWYKSRIGIHVMAYSFNLSLIYIVSIANTAKIFPPEVRPYLTMVMAITTALVCVWRLAEYIRERFLRKPKSRALHRKGKE